MANDAGNGFTFLYSLLSADATLTALLNAGAVSVVRDVAPQGSLPDWLVIGHQAGQDVMSATANRIMSPNLYRIFAVGPESDYANLKAISDRVDALLHPSGNPLRFTTSGGVSILACYREQPLAISETVQGSAQGAAWLNLGGLYRIIM